MRQTLGKGMVAAAAATSILSLCGSPAMADAYTGGTAKDSPGVLSGNSLEVPIDAPVNACGDSVDGVAGFNPTFGNSCAGGTESHRHSEHTERHRWTEPSYGDSDDDSGYGSGDDSGYGYVEHSGYGSGDHSGYGSGDHSGYGSGDHSGYGSGDSGHGKPDCEETPPPPHGGDHTPPPTGGDHTPPPPTGGDHTPPPPTGGEHTPPPPTGGDHTPPPTGGNHTPPPPTGGDHTPPPPTGGNHTPPPTGGDHTPPPTGGNHTPPPTGGDHTPPPGGGSHTPPPVLAHTGSEAMLATSAVSAALIAGGTILYRRGRAAARR
ncbi:chaplin family protein [Streptomyces sp. NPDC050508]|uniref:chaplin family protein n=1 Tax=Streptomyces sp. NPDC050508 TaxID=3155405 RepID=UPI00344325F5